MRKPINYSVSVFILLFGMCQMAWASNTSTLETESPDRDLTGFEGLNESLPLWEFGVGGGAVETANYPSSSERNFVALVLPYIVYRGDVVRVGGGNGARAVVVEESDYELDLSLGGAFSADSEDNSARAGMPELDYLFEVGPQLVYKVNETQYENGGVSRLNARLQARAVFSTDFERIDSRGYVVEPTLSYQQRGVLFAETGLNLSMSFMFASEKLQDYFYEVDSPFVTAERSEFNAEGGYLGAELSFSVSFPIRKNIRGFFGGSVNLHHGAANENSPLFEKDTTYSVGAGFIWRLYESEAVANW